MDINLGELITILYQEYLAVFKDEDLAAVAAAATINELLNAREEPLPTPPALRDAHVF